MPQSSAEHKCSANVLNGIFMYQLSLEISVCVKSKWNINVPLGGLVEHLCSWENGYCENFNSKLRDEFLNGEIFYSMK